MFIAQVLQDTELCTSVELCLLDGFEMAVDFYLEDSQMVICK